MENKEEAIVENNNKKKYDELYLALKNGNRCYRHLSNLLYDCKDLVDEEIVALWIKKYSVFYSDIKMLPDELLTERILRCGLEKDKEFLSMLPVERRTPRMYEIAAEYGYCDEMAPQHIKEIFASKKEKEYANEHINERRYARLYNTAKLGEFYLYRLLRDDDYRALMDEEILDMYIKQYSVSLNNIPEKFLTEEILRRVLEKNNEALKTLSAEKITPKMREIAAEYGYCDEESPEHIKKIFEEKKKLTNEQNKLKKAQNQILDYENLIIDYINSDCNNIEEFCEKSLFYKALEYVEQYNTELYDCYKEFANIKEKEGFDYVSEIISKILELYKKDNDHDKTTSKNNFNVVNYWLITDFEPRKMLRILKYWRGISPAFIVEFSQKILKNSKTSLLELEAYKSTKYTFATGTLPQDKKGDIVNFLINNGVPINTVSLGDVSSRFMSNQIDLSEIHEKIHYDVNDFKRSEIREKSKIIVGQLDTISSLDAMISKLSEEKENLDSQIKGGKK